MRTKSSRHRLGRFVLCAIALGAGAAEAQTVQTAPPTDSPGRWGWTLSPYVGLSSHSPAGRHWGRTRDRRHVITGLHATFPILRGPRWTVAYAPDAIPVIVVSNNPDYRTVRNAATGATSLVETGRSNVWGAGVSPIALELQVDASRRIGAFAGGAVGGLWFTRRVPVMNARAFNFTFDFGGGLRFRVSDDYGLRVAYKFHHFSNAGTAPRNPGVDAKVFLVGLERGFGAK